MKLNMYTIILNNKNSTNYFNNLNMQCDIYSKMLFYELKLPMLNTDIQQNTKTLLFEKLNSFLLRNHLEIIQAQY